ncbi:hypothetical protein M422DRAFT_248486 [Sphaerobolus stellatus SS14]|uniref:Arrestin-like N-terminal domain-containing protein n=1 Tax=Sphaerobolus stellatus (strain SS14) TaxID=990650 RepID=A0A0C9UW47_SPHS4|nr:hypothetical protein M422DRAFT_248486 [Sphaerobolus stellatus SS14]
MPQMNLPPSFQAGTGRTGGSIQYYLHVVGVRKPWYKVNIRINQAFPFLPVDRSLPPPAEPNVADEWEAYTSSAEIKKGFMSSKGVGYVTSEFYLPKMARIPLFRGIPIRLRFICASKSLPSSSSKSVDQFDFPRIPVRASIELTLREKCMVTAQGYNEDCKVVLDSQGSFGTSLRPDQVRSKITEPHWVEDEEEKGHWVEEVDYWSTIVFRRPTPFTSNSISTSVYLGLSIRFPGPGNVLSTEIGPLPLTSGISPSEAKAGVGSVFPEIDLPPSLITRLHNSMRRISYSSF